MRRTFVLQLIPMLAIVAGPVISAEPEDPRIDEVRFNFLTKFHKALPGTSNELAILTVNICSERPNIFLNQLSVQHTVSKHRYYLRSYQAGKKGWSWSTQQQIQASGNQNPSLEHIQHNGIVQHTFFLDAPAGRFQITDLLLERRGPGTRQRFSTVENIEGLFFWYDHNVALSYLGELNLSFADGFSSGPVLFVTRMTNHYVADIKTRFAAINDRDIDDGNLWLQDAGGGMRMGGERAIVCQFTQLSSKPVRKRGK